MRKQETLAWERSTEGDTTVSMSWTVDADGASHILNLSFEGACTEPATEPAVYPYIPWLIHAWIISMPS